MCLYRIHIRPKVGNPHMQTTFDYCLNNGFLGVGWGVKSLKNTNKWEKYEKAVKALTEPYKLQICSYIHKWIKKDDLVWTRNIEGQYYLTRVKSGWEYFRSPEAEEKDIDISNIFRCEFQKVDTDMVPGKVVASFRASRTIQSIDCDKAAEYSKYLWNMLTNKSYYEIDKSKYADIFMMLDDQETEDLVFTYLQSKGWWIIPNSRKRDTMKFEYLAINPRTGEKAETQVKTGNEKLNRENYKLSKEKVFLFQSNELYFGSEADNVVCLTRKQLSNFLNAHISILPGYFKTKMDMIG